MAEEVKLVVETPESVALKLTRDISSREGLYKNSMNYRKEILDLYTECLIAVHGGRDT